MPDESADQRLNHGTVNAFDEDLRSELVGLARQLLRDRDLAEDVVQDVLLKSLRQHDTTSFSRAYLSVAVRRQSWNEMRNARRWRTMASHLSSEMRSNLAAACIELPAYEHGALLDRLPARAREVTRLRLAGMSCREIAQDLGVTVKAVEKRIAFARRMLAPLMEQ